MVMLDPGPDPAADDRYAAFWDIERPVVRERRHPGILAGVGTAVLPMVALMILLAVVLAWIG